MATRREIFKQLVAVAGECYPEVEAQQIAEMIVTTKGGISRNIYNIYTVFSIYKIEYL